MKTISSRHLMIFFQGLHHLLSAGLDLITALELQSRHHPRYLESLKRVTGALRQGNTLSMALAQYFVMPRIVSMYLYQSEMHGDVALACQLSFSWLQDQQAWRRMLWQLSFYPILLVLTSMGLLAVMLHFVLPEFAALYATLNVDLPVSTAWLIDFSQNAPHLVRNMGLFFSASILIAYFGWKRSQGRFLLETWMCRVPGIRKMMRLHHEYQLSLQLGTLLQHGCTLLQAIEVIRLGTPSPLFQSYLSQSHHLIAQGKSLTQSLCHGLMSHQPFTGLIAHAQLTGRLDLLLLNLAKQHKDTSHYWQDQAKHLIQPCITLLLGGFLGFWILLLYYPMLQLGTNLG